MPGADCQLVSGTTVLEIDYVIDIEPPTISANSTMLATATGPTTLSVRCGTELTAYTYARSGGTRILATKVGAIH
jgi:hypothetical protein